MNATATSTKKSLKSGNAQDNKESDSHETSNTLANNVQGKSKEIRDRIKRSVDRLDKETDIIKEHAYKLALEGIKY